MVRFELVLTRLPSVSPEELRRAVRDMPRELSRGTLDHAIRSGKLPQAAIAWSESEDPLRVIRARIAELGGDARIDDRRTRLQIFADDLVAGARRAFSPATTARLPASKPETPSAQIGRVAHARGTSDARPPGRPASVLRVRDPRLDAGRAAPVRRATDIRGSVATDAPLGTDAAPRANQPPESNTVWLPMVPRLRWLAPAAAFVFLFASLSLVYVRYRAFDVGLGQLSHTVATVKGARRTDIEAVIEESEGRVAGPVGAAHHGASTRAASQASRPPVPSVAPSQASGETPPRPDLPSLDVGVVVGTTLALFRGLGFESAARGWELVALMLGLLASQAFVYGLRHSFTTGPAAWRARTLALAPACSAVLGIVAIGLPAGAPSRSRPRPTPSIEASTAATDELGGRPRATPGARRRTAGASGARRDYGAALDDFGKIGELGKGSLPAMPAGPSRPFAGLLAELRRRKATRLLGLDQVRVTPSTDEVAELTGGERGESDEHAARLAADSRHTRSGPALRDAPTPRTPAGVPSARDSVAIDEPELLARLRDVAARMAGPAPDLWGSAPSWPRRASARTNARVEPMGPGGTRPIRVRSARRGR